MKSFITFIALSLVLVGCNQQKQKEEEQGGVTQIRGAELETLTRICESLEKKREYHETLTDGQISYDLRTKKRDCGDTTEFDLGRFRASLRRIIGRDTYLETSSRTRLLKDIVTDRNGDLSHFCDKLFSGAVVDNTMTVGSNKFQLNLSSDSQYDIFSLAKARANSNGAFIVYEIEKGSLFTSRSRAQSSYMGVLKERLVIRDCAVGADQTFRQVFNSY
ncbi:MAG: hypothetical protein EP319_04975 [Deltaproteobacteria bacterium]|nr:MAG: hypothetical protein EP319_04975 [Deltaproteobacteria bacterium]